MLPEEAQNHFIKVIKRVSIIITFLGTSALIFRNFTVFWGIIIGGVMAIINFRLIAISTVQILELSDPTQAKEKAIVKYIIRAILTIGVMYVAFTNHNINFAALAVGLLLVKYVILFDAVITSGKTGMQDFFKNLKLKYERGENNG